MEKPEEEIDLYVIEINTRYRYNSVNELGKNE